MSRPESPITDYLLPLFIASFKDPRGTAEIVESDAFLNRIAPLGIIVITIIGTISSVLSIWMSDAPTVSVFQSLADVPILFALVQFAAFLLTVLGIVFIGRIFGGQGDFSSTFTLMTWLQFLSLVCQLILWPFVFLLGGIVGLISAGLTAYFLWLTLVYIATAHGFQSLFLVFLVTVGCLFTLSFVFVIFATMFGILPEQLPNV